MLPFLETQTIYCGGNEIYIFSECDLIVNSCISNVRKIWLKEKSSMTTFIQTLNFKHGGLSFILLGK